MNQRLSKEARTLLQLKRAKKFLIQAWVGTALLMIWMLPMWISGTMLGGQLLTTLMLLAISSWIVFVCGSKVIKSAWISTIHLTPNMHLLTSLGTLAALLTGLLNILHIMGLFPTVGNFTGLAGMIMSFHLTGSYIEQKLKHRSAGSIKALISISPQYAMVIRNGEELRIAISELEVGDLAIVKSGEKIPSDGVVVEGESEINESLVTGESIPVYKQVGDAVIGGSINIDGRLKVKIEKIGKQTFLQQIIRLVETAQGSKPKIQLIADKVIAVFVPCILLISAMSFLAWMFFYPQIIALISSLGVSLSSSLASPFTAALYSSIAVLVVACPCALGLATPSAIAIGVGRAAQLGALIKNATIFENLKSSNIIVMDKTGTITEGSPSIEAIYVPEGQDEGEMFRLAAIIEQNSHHPLAKSVLEYYYKNYASRFDSADIGGNVEAVHHTQNQNAAARTKQAALPMPESYQTLQGKGLYGIVNHKDVYVVNPAFLQENSYELNTKLSATLETYFDRGLTIAVVIFDKEIIGLIGFVDKPHADSAQAIAALHKMNLAVYMLTGDHESAAQKIAEQVNVDKIVANAKPNAKLAHIQSLQEAGNHVVMVGDGINDAPALSQAHIGVAMGTGTDVAAEAGDVVLLRGTLPVLVSTLQLSKLTYRIITQNLFWAFVYNVLLIPLSIVGFVHPLYAEVAMAISSITVLLNSIRISRFRPKI